MSSPDYNYSIFKHNQRLPASNCFRDIQEGRITQKHKLDEVFENEKKHSGDPSKPN